MNKLNRVFLQSTLFLFLLIALNSCHEQTPAKHTSEVGQENATQQPTNNLKPAISIDKNIRSIFQDKKGTFWFGTNGAGVYRYDTKSVKQFTVKDGLADNQVVSIQEDEFGNLWFGSGAFGITKFDGTTFSVQSKNVKRTRGTQNDWKSATNDVWFYAGGGVMRYRSSKLSYLPFDPSSSNPQTNDPFSLSRYGVYSMLKDKKGNLWFGTQAEGVCKFDGKTLTWFKEKGLAGPAVLGIFEDSKGRIWFGNNGAGLFYYDGYTLTNFTEENGLSNANFRASGKPGLGTMARVYSINEDTYGNIWIGTVDAGVWKFDGINLTNYTTKNGLTSNAINTIYKDKKGELWFGTDAHGICKFNGTGFVEFIIR